MSDRQNWVGILRVRLRTAPVLYPRTLGGAPELGAVTGWGDASRAGEEQQKESPVLRSRRGSSLLRGGPFLLTPVTEAPAVGTWGIKGGERTRTPPPL